jgi:hypothetical protein
MGSLPVWMKWGANGIRAAWIAENINEYRNSEFAVSLIAIMTYYAVNDNPNT